jgi:hypothetical protein
VVGHHESRWIKDKPSGSQRTIHIVVAALVVVLLPVALMGALVGKFGADAMFVGIAFGVLGCIYGGTRRMLYVIPGLVVAAGLGAFTAYGWWWPVLLAFLGVVAGGGTYWGWQHPLLMLPFAATFATPVPSGRDAAVYGVIAGIAAAYGVVLARRFGAPGNIEGRRLSPALAAVVAPVFGIALGASAAIGVALGWTQPYWVPEPILILSLYITIGKRERIRQKAVATALGVVLVVPVAILALPTWAISIIASTAFVVALTQFKRYWLFYTLYTFALVLACSTPGKAGAEAAKRGTEILAGIAILIVGLAVIRVVGGWLSKRYPQPELASSIPP